ncbi:MAG: alpha-N-acetylglucosaminidase TIM-barrel domain-containing protein [Terriglobia bacterium]
MRRRNFLAATLSPLISTGVPAWTAHADATNASPGIKPQDVTIVFNSKDSAETVAAQELQSFLSRMTNVHPGIVSGDSTASGGAGPVHFVVGRTKTTEELIAQGQLDDPIHRSPEAYVVRAIDSGGKTQVVFLGGTGIATLYAVYRYLEKSCGCGFYWDGDHMPRRETLPAQGVSIAAEPYFRERMCMNLTLYWYSAPWWEWKDWKQYLDWALKARFNILSLWDTPGEDVVWKKVWKRLGVEVADSSWSGPPYEIFAPIKYGVRGPNSDEWREGQSALTQKILRYIRERGMRTLAPAVPGIVPPEYAAVHPEARTFELSWSNLPKQRYLHPLSPEYHAVGKAFLEEYIALYGTDHLYWLENYLECDVVGPEELQREVRREIQGANFKVVDEVDPQGVGIFSAWTYLVAPQHWTPQLMQESLERMPADRVRVLDQFAEMIPEHKRANYFSGRPWYFGAVYAFGGLTQMHGSLPFIEKQFHSVVDDPNAKQCVGFYPNEETIRHNYFYFEFLCRLGWNPQEVHLRSFTQDYARERYGESAAPAMVAALGELLASIYGSDDQTQPAYWHRLNRRPGNLHMMESYRLNFIPHLRKALEHALEAAPVLKGHPLYRHDLNDIAHQYLADLFGAHVIKLEAAHDELDKAAFEREAGLLESLLRSIEELLSHDDFYWISPWIRQARTLPGAPVDVDVRARDILTLWAGVIRDYACRDYYELVQGYYHPRVSAYIAALRDALAMDQRRLYDSAELDRQYDAIEKKWVADGFPLVDRQPDPEEVIPTVKKLLAKFA